jgi:hypothetical protein
VIVRVKAPLARALALVGFAGSTPSATSSSLLWLAMVAGAGGGAASFALRGLHSLAMPATAALVLAVACAGAAATGELS